MKQEKIQVDRPEKYPGSVCVIGPLRQWAEVMSTFWQEVGRLVGAPPPAIASWAERRPGDYKVMQEVARSPEAALGWGEVAKRLARQPAGGATLMVAQLDDRDAAVWQVLRRKGRGWRWGWPKLAEGHIAVHQQTVLVVWGDGMVGVYMPEPTCDVFNFDGDRLWCSNFRIAWWIRAIYPKHAAEGDRLRAQHGLPEPPGGGLWRTVIDCRPLFTVAAEIRVQPSWPEWPRAYYWLWWLISDQLAGPESLRASSLYYRPIKTITPAVSRLLNIPRPTIAGLIEQR